MKTTLINEFLKSGNSHELKVTCNASGTKFTATLLWDNQIFQTAQGETFGAAMEALEAVMTALDD